MARPRIVLTHDGWSVTVPGEPRDAWIGGYNALGVLIGGALLVAVPFLAWVETRAGRFGYEPLVFSALLAPLYARFAATATPSLWRMATTVRVEVRGREFRIERRLLGIRASLDVLPIARGVDTRFLTRGRTGRLVVGELTWPFGAADSELEDEVVRLLRGGARLATEGPDAVAPVPPALETLRDG